MFSSSMSLSYCGLSYDFGNDYCLQDELSGEICYCATNSSPVHCASSGEFDLTGKFMFSLVRTANNLLSCSSSPVYDSIMPGVTDTFPIPVEYIVIKTLFSTIVLLMFAIFFIINLLESPSDDHLGDVIVGNLIDDVHDDHVIDGGIANEVIIGDVGLNIDGNVLHDRDNAVVLANRSAHISDDIIYIGG